VKTTLSPVRIFLFFVFVGFPSAIFAHQLDEYLQATLVVIEPDRIRLQINLTPGVAVAEQVLDSIDSDHNGVISTNEAAAYCGSLKHDLIVRLDKRDLKLKVSASYFPGCEELRTGWGFVQVEFSAAAGRLTSGAHTLSIENRHMPSNSVYLVNAAQPASAAIQITKQIRNENQSRGEIQFTCQATPNSFRAPGMACLFLMLVVAVTAGAVRGTRGGRIGRGSPSRW
jgi:hypothetical protein